MLKANRIRSQQNFIVKEAIKIKSKTKNKPKNEKQTNQTKNKAKKGMETEIKKVMPVWMGIGS